MRTLLLILLVAFATISFAQQRNGKGIPTTIEQRLVDTILNLPEVRQKAKNVQKASKGHRKLSVVIWEKPTQASRFYWLKVKEENDTNVFTHFNFFIDRDSLTIKYFDAPSDKAITLGEWRSGQKKSL